MISVRKCVFETNSSSSHSIVITKSRSPESINRYFTAYLSPYDDYVLKLWDSELEFGRSPFDLLDTFEKKVCYALAYYGKQKFDEINSLVIKYLKDADNNHSCKGIQLPMVRACEWDDKSEIDEYGRIPYYGEVDHQSMGLLDLMLRKEGITLEQFLLNPNYMVIIDGDEYCIWYEFKSSGIVNKDNINTEYGLGDL